MSPTVQGGELPGRHRRHPREVPVEVRLIGVPERGRDVKGAPCTQNGHSQTGGGRSGLEPGSQSDSGSGTSGIPMTGRATMSHVWWTYSMGEYVVGLWDGRLLPGDCCCELVAVGRIGD